MERTWLGQRPFTMRMCVGPSWPKGVQETQLEEGVGLPLCTFPLVEGG